MASSVGEAFSKLSCPTLSLAALVKFSMVVLTAPFAIVLYGIEPKASDTAIAIATGLVKFFFFFILSPLL